MAAITRKSTSIARQQTTEGDLAMSINNLDAYYGKFHAVHDVTMQVPRNQITALIGPSGSGKSTLLRCLNRIHETAIGASSTGHVIYEGLDIYKDMDAGDVRRSIGMVFQRPNPLVTKTIYDNVAVGLQIVGITRKSELSERVEQALRRAALWDEVKDKLQQPGVSISGGQQQRLCIARALAVEPTILLMDEPASALDPVSTLKIEDLMYELKETITILIVTHNMQQAARSSDQVAVLMMDEDRAGVLVEMAQTRQIFTSPRDERTEAYITGRIG